MESFIHTWQHIPEHIRPYVFRIGSFELRYYALMYIVAFTIVYLLSLYRIRNEDYDYSRETIDNYFTWAIIGLMAGARFGYVLFYDFSYYISRPWEIILPFSFTNGIHFTGLSGMSYHGGLIGVITASYLYCRKSNIGFWRFADFIVPSIPLGYTFGRMGNFINGELYGRVTTVPWGMYFPLDYTNRLRHPSQLYEALFEGVFLFLVLWSIRKKKFFDGFYLSLYIMGYGTVRFFIEYVRQPDPQLGIFFHIVTMGQMLCLAMVAGGMGLLYYRNKRAG
jgi:phosphatidylglycerol:prolipoprotein diacylglycerol transferase